MKVKFFIFIFLTVSQAMAMGDSTKKNHLIKINPMSPMDFDNSFNVAYEGFFRKNKSFQAEAGYGNTNMNLLMGDDYDQFRGFNVVKLRSEYRQYKLNRIDKLPAGPYFAVELFYKSVFKKDMVNIGRGTIGNIPQYWEYVEGVTKKNVLASHVKFGTQFFFLDDFMDRKRRLMMDIYIGFGVRVVDNRYSYQNKKPDDFRGWERNRTFATIAPSNRTTPYVSAVVGFKLGYLL